MSVDGLLAALADPRRRQLLDHVVAAGGASATELARAAPVSRQAVVKHLQVLAEAGLVAPVRHGREVRYEPVPEALAPLAEWVADTSAAWDRRLARLRTRALGHHGDRIDVDSTPQG